MGQQRVEHRSPMGGAEPDIIPFPSRSSRGKSDLPRASEILTREFKRLLDRNWVSALSFWRERTWNHCQRSYSWLARRPHPYRAVFVIATPRSGSNLLIDYLSWLPGLGCLSEVLNWGLPIGPKKFVHPQQALKHVKQSLHTLRTTHRACKLFLPELDHYRLQIDDLERAFLDARYLVLYRENLAAQFVSREVARHTGQWSLLPGQTRKNAMVTIGPSELSKYCEETSRLYTNAADHHAIARRGAILSYEQLTANPARCLREVVCPLLGVPYSEPKSTLRKQSDGSLASRVSNYAEIASILNGPECRLQLHSTRALHAPTNAA